VQGRLAAVDVETRPRDASGVHLPARRSRGTDDVQMHSRLEPLAQDDRLERAGDGAEDVGSLDRFTPCLHRLDLDVLPLRLSLGKPAALGRRLVCCTFRLLAPALTPDFTRASAP